VYIYCFLLHNKLFDLFSSFDILSCVYEVFCSYILFFVWLSMRKMYLIGLLFIWWLLLTGCNKNELVNDVEQNATTNQESLDASEKFSSTMSEVFKKWKTVTCTFSMNMDGTQAEWIFYVEGKKMRYAIKASSQGIEMKNDVVVKDWYSYSRTNLDPQNGYKMKELEMESDAAMWPEEREQEVEFVCKKWVPSWIFDLPKNVNFKEFSYDNSDI